MKKYIEPQTKLMAVAEEPLLDAASGTIDIIPDDEPSDEAAKLNGAPVGVWDE